MKNTLTMVEKIEMGPSVSNNHIVFISHHKIDVIRQKLDVE